MLNEDLRQRLEAAGLSIEAAELMVTAGSVMLAEPIERAGKTVRIRAAGWAGPCRGIPQAIAGWWFEGYPQGTPLAAGEDNLGGWTFDELEEVARQHGHDGPPPY